MAGPRAKAAKAHQNNRAKVSNGSRLFIDGVPVDGRTAIARRFRDHMDDLTEMVGGAPSAAQDMLIRRAAALATQCDFDEARIAAGEKIAEDIFLQRTKALVLVLTKLGLNERARIIEPKVITPAVIDAHAEAVAGEP